MNVTGRPAGQTVQMGIQRKAKAETTAVVEQQRKAVTNEPQLAAIS